MKKIEIFIGSPRKKGNTNTMAEMLISGLDKNKISGDISFLYDFDIKPCVDCRGCKRGNMECLLKDDMADLYERIENCDILILATPIYWFGPSGQLKLFLDRFRPWYGNKKLESKYFASLLPAGTGATDCDLTIEMFRRAAEALGMITLGTVTAKAYDKDEVKDDAEAMENLKRLTNKICSLETWLDN